MKAFHESMPEVPLSEILAARREGHRH